MKKILSNKVGSIIKEKRKLEKVLNVKISNRGKEIFAEGDALNEYYAEKVLDAIDFGFSTETALLIKERELIFERLNIKDFTRRKDLATIRARIIGTKGKTLSTLSNLTDCFFEIKDNEVGIIGYPEKMKIAEEAVVSIIKGSKQSNTYKFLERNQVKPVVDLGLKEEE